VNFCLCYWLLDGFVSADFSDAGGELITAPLIFSGSRLHLNINGKRGQGRVELLDADSNPISGFELAACRRITADSVRQVVSWKGRSDLSRLKGQPIHVRFRMGGAKLYAFQFAN
jgi:hypothetical protein